MSNDGRAVSLGDEGEAVPDRQRIHWLDNLRVFAIFCVVVIHAGLVYESSGIAATFWIVDDPATNDLIGIINLVLDIFVMPTIFFISGYLTPGALDNRTRGDFLRTRFRRLMIPWIVAVFTLIPIYKVIFLYSRGLPQEHWSSYFHFSNGIWGQNWLWFLPVLFLFDLLYALISKWEPALTRMSFRFGVMVAFVIGLGSSVAFDLLNAEGWTKTPLIDFQNERLLVYFMIFLLGSSGSRRQIFASRPASKKLYVVVSATAWIPVGFYTVLVIIWTLNPAFVLISPGVGSLVFWLSYCLSLLCLLYLIIETFRFYLDRPGRIWSELSKSSYYVYIIHVVVLGGLALLLLPTVLPPLVKYALLASLTFVASNLVVSLTRRAAFRGQVLPERAARASRA
jgi:surface polysaccharide O-acyltransferase-like enzyme